MRLCCPRIAALVLALCAGARAASAHELHGFVSEGGFWSTDNDYIGHSSQGSAKLLEAAVNVSAAPVEGLRVGLQLFARSVGDFDESPRLDWGFVDYRFRPEVGVRFGVIKMPFGLYNEYTDIDAARLPILMPQSVYPIRNRDVLLAHTGMALYGERELGAGGSLEYQAWLGTLTIPRNALELSGAELTAVDTKYVTGAQLFWATPVDGLRVGGTFLRASIDFHLTLDDANTQAVIGAGLAPPDFDGRIVVSQRPDTLVVGSAEYVRDAWTFAAEYSRWLKRQRSTLPDALPTFEEDAERFYALAGVRLTPRFETGAYYSVAYADVDDRAGHGMKFAQPFLAWQRDLAATLRFDVNDHWLWKAEAHFIDGAADLGHEGGANPAPERYWGLFLIRTTAYF